MVTYLLTPPGLYYLIIFIVVVSVLVYWKREAVKQEIRRWRGKEISIGPVKLERKPEEKGAGEKKGTAGVSFGEESDFTGGKISRVAGRDIVRGEARPAKGGATPGVDFGKKGKFNQAEIEDIAGRDLIGKDGEDEQTT